MEEERRLERLEDAIDKLTDISVDLKQIIAVHEQRITQQEKNSSIILTMLETRRSEVDQQFREVYDTVERSERRLKENIEHIKENNQEQHMTLNSKLSVMEKYIWMAMGGGIVISWLLTNAIKFIK